MNLNEVKPVNLKRMVDIHYRRVGTEGEWVSQGALLFGLDWPHARVLRKDIARAFKLHITRTKPARERLRISPWRVYLGCTIEEFLIHIQSQFVGEMKIENYSLLWELRYKTTLSEFNMSINDEMMKAFNYTNIEPDFCHNRPTSKQDKYDMMQAGLKSGKGYAIGGGGIKLR